METVSNARSRAIVSAKQAALSKHRRLVIARFVARRSRKGAVLWGLVFGILVASKSIDYASIYPTAAARAKIAASFSNNVGLNALLGKPHHINTVVGFTAWNALTVTAIVGAIWAFLLASKTLRGEETAGRWELMLTGRNTARQATANVLAGLGTSLLTLYAVAGLAFIAVGHVHTVNFSPQAALFLALACVSAAAEFLAVGALASQLMPTRSRAASLAAGVFGLSFLIKAVGDASGATWLLNVSPLGWIEKLQPLYGSQPQWLLPIAGFVVVLTGLTIFLAGRRDLGDSMFADKDTAKPRSGLLKSPLGLALRLTRITAASWLVGIGLLALFYGLLTKAAAQAFNASQKALKVESGLVHGSQHAGAVLFLGIVFLFVMALTMAYTASAVGAMREDEAVGYLDNIFVRPVSRLRWLVGRAGLAVVVVALAGIIGGVATWVGVASQHIDVSFHTLLIAGLNTLAPAYFTLGLGVLALGLVPRITTLVVYGVIAWSFLLQLLSSGINLNHWLLDTSIMQHVPLAPAASPDWRAAAILTGLGLLAAIVGAAIFRTRDLQTE
jgi:ABC-2 type transport system permease protein